MHDHMPSGPNRTERMPSSSPYAKLLGNSSFALSFIALHKKPHRT